MATRLPAADPRLSDSSSADADSTSSALTPASSDPPSSTAFPSSRRRAAPTPTPMPAAGASVPAYLDDASEEDVFNTRKKRARRGSQDVRPCSAVFVASRLPPLMGVVAARVVDRTTIQPIAPASQDPFLPESVGLSTSSKVKAAKAKPIVNDPPASHLPFSSIGLSSPPARGAQAETFPPPLVAFPPPKRSAAAASSKARSREPDRAGEAGPSGKKARRRPAGVDGGDEDVEEGLEAGARLMDEVSNERGRRSKLVGRRPPATLKFLDFPPRPPSPPAAGSSSSSRTKTAPVIPPLASTSSSKYFSLQPPRTPSSLPQQQHDQDASGDSLVPLQISDTPMIRKNQEMRANVSKRKSSFGLRGQRASASFGKGEATAPHAAVPPESFYKHIDGDLPPAVQMRHLLVFLGKRVGPPSTLAVPSAAPTAATAADAKGKGKLTTADEGSRTAKGAAIADEIIEETLRQLMRAKVDTNPSSSSGVHAFQLPSRPTRPHPGNVLNRKAQEEGERIIRQGQEEEARWSAAVKAANALQTRTCEALAHKIARLDLAEAGEVDEQALDDEAEREAARLAMGVLRRSEEPSVTLPDDLEFQIDLLRQTTTTAVQFSLESTRILDGTFATLATRLRARDVLLPSEAMPSSFPSAAAAVGLGLTSSDSRPPSKEDPMGMLRALAARSHSPSTSFSSTPAPPTSAAPPTTPAPPPQTPGRRGLLGAAGVQTPSRRGTGVTPHRARTPGGEGTA